MAHEPKVIYDFGSHSGEDLPYYLKKADKVVAVEADPELAEGIRNRFEGDIAAGRLVVENCVLVAGESESTVAFHIHRQHRFLSQFPAPPEHQRGDFDIVKLPSMNPRHLIEKHGRPYYLKVDIEHYDAVILRELFSNNIRPPFISAESHSIDVFALLVAMGGYSSFNLVDGPTVESTYRDALIQTLNGKEKYSFPRHSAGPFGEDIEGDWMTPDNFFKFLALRGLGWKDIHASTTMCAAPERCADLSLVRTPRIVRTVGNMAPSFLRPILRRIRDTL